MAELAATSVNVRDPDPAARAPALSLYEQVMGDAYQRLDAPVQAFHRLAGRQLLQGFVRVEAPDTWLARFIARRLALPAARGEGPIRFELEATPLREIWTRHFPSGSLRSCMEARTPGVQEWLGPARLVFALEAVDGRLVMRPRGMHTWGLPWPSWLLPQVIAEESGRGGRFHFLVRVALPLVGRIMGYTGYLELPEPEAA